MVIGICPTVDFAFKCLFGSPEHVAVTKHFLNSVLVGGPRITRVEFRHPFLEKTATDDKLALLDILATDEHSRRLNIEMQTTLPVGMSKRLAYYASRLYYDQLLEGEQYVDLCPAISICVLTKSLFPASPELHLDFRLRAPTGQLLTNDLQIHLLELPKLRVTAENVYRASPIEQWAFFMLNAQYLTPRDVARLFPDHEFSEAAGILQMIARTPEQQALYDARLKFQRDEAAKLEGARLEGREEAREEGRVEGKKEGLRKGELLGRVLLLRELLNLTTPTHTELVDLSESELSAMADDLQSRLRHRGQ